MKLDPRDYPSALRQLEKRQARSSKSSMLIYTIGLVLAIGIVAKYFLA